MKSYDYEAALRIVDTVRKESHNTAFTQECRDFPFAATQRIKLDTKPLVKCIDSLQLDKTEILPAQQNQILFEFLFYLQIKLECKEYSYFLRGMTPLLFRLSEAYMTQKLGFSVKDYTRDNRLFRDRFER